MSERNRVVLAPVASAIVVGTAAGGLESRAAIHLHRRIAVADLEMDAPRAGGSRLFDELLEKPSADQIDTTRAIGQARLNRCSNREFGMMFIAAARARRRSL